MSTSETDRWAAAASGLRLGLAGEDGVELDELLVRCRVPGVSIAVIDAGRIAWTHACGRRTARLDEPATPATRFQAGSISKSIAALCAMRLVARGELDLDGDVNAGLRQWKLRDGTGSTARVSLRQLLSHRGGVNVPWYPGYPRDGAVPRLPDVLDGTGAANSSPVRVTGLPGRHVYSGGGYSVLQQLLIDRTGSPFEQLVRDLVLAPLGMHDSGYEPEPACTSAVTADGHRVDGLPVRGGSFVYPEMAAAGLWSTASDLARFLIGVQDALRGAPGAVLPAELAQAMVADEVGDGYGLGLRLWDSPGPRAFGHGGDTQGFLAHTVADVDGRHGAVVMTNCDHGPRVVQPLLERIAQLGGWAPGRAPALAAGTGVAGRYRLADGSSVAVRSDAAGVLLCLSGQPPLPLRAVAQGRFASEALNVQVSFHADAGEERPSIEIWQETERALQRLSGRHDGDEETT